MSGVPSDMSDLLATLIGAVVGAVLIGWGVWARHWRVP